MSNYYNKYLKYKHKYLLLKGGNNKNINAMILPHAGLYYIKSILDYMFNDLNLYKYNKIILLSTNHFNHNNTLYTSYEEFKQKSQEHSPISVQSYIDNHNIPINIYLISHYDKTIIDKIYQECITNNILLLSNTDLLHCGPNYNKKCPEDIYNYNKNIITNILNNQIEQDDNMCGKAAIQIFLEIINKLNYNYIEHIYTSSDIVETNENSVGYVGISYSSNKSYYDNNYLLDICKETLQNYFKNKTEKYKIKLEINNVIGLFVTIKKNNNLRGCIGTFHKNKDIIETIQEYTLNAALHDSRFNKIEEKELIDLSYEITYLKKPFITQNIFQDFISGLHGITIHFEDNSSATYIAEVMIEHFNMPKNNKLTNEKFNEIKKSLQNKAETQSDIKYIELYECL